MTKKQLEKIIDKWQARLGLTDWLIGIKTSDTVKIGDDEVFMRTHRSKFYKRATIEVSKYVFDQTLLPECIEKDLLEGNYVTHEESIECSAVHELLHCALRDLMEVSELICDHLNPPVKDVWDGAWMRAEEDFVESLAVSLVRNWGT